jgi:tetratricopeptide (TPR) repeat protein
MLDDPAQAIEHLDAALALAPGNALLYVERGNANQRLMKLGDARRDLETAEQIGPANWTMPALMRATFTDNLNQVLSLFEKIIAQRPDDWFPLFFRGAIYYQSGAYDVARRDIEQAIALQPTANFPYVYGALLALHQGRIQDASLMVRTILEQFPDPAHMNRLIGAMFGEDTLASFGYTLSGFGNMVLGRYDQVLAAAAGGLEQNYRDPDMHMMQGFAQCALGEYQDAELSYTRAIGLDPDFTILYLLRAEVRRKQRNFDGAAEDLKTVNDSPHGAEFRLLTEAIRQGTAGCGNFFRLDNPVLQPSATATSDG